MTRCKFKCVEAKNTSNDEAAPLYSYEFQAVTRGSAENDSFFKYTPWGTLKFGVTTERKFELGKEYFLDITEA